MKKNLIIAISLLTVFCTSCSQKPFFTSLIKNQNVYKTKDTLDLKVVYDLESKIPVKKDDSLFRVVPNKPSFLRYSIVKENEKPFIYILPYSCFEKKLNDTTILIKYAEGSNSDLNEYYYQFTEKAKEISPAKYYLASEHITGIPITIPIKYRFNAPSNKTPYALNASISYAFGYKIRVNNDPYKDNFFRILPLVVGFSTDTYLAKDSISKPGYKGETSVALNMAIGLTYEVSNKFNVGLFFGKDKMFSSQKDWIYQNKSWLGFGLGYKFAATKEEKE